jgi:dTDP-4-amino-4,6-dideoxygalactose transaminase
METRIPFNRPSLTGDEHTYIADALARSHLSGDGLYTAKCQAILESTLGVPKALLTTSCTHALEMAALLLDIRPGDEIVIPTFTFSSTANAFVLRGARPRFIDVRPDTLNLDEAALADTITERTKAIVVVHYAGVGCEMDAIQGTASRAAIPIVEDNAHGLFGKYRGRFLGTFGALAAQSFHETKNVMSGEGGALLFNDRRYVERGEVIRHCGTDRSRFFRGEVEQYTWVDVGSNYVPSEISAALLCAQLESWETIQKRRRVIWDFYADALRGWAAREHVQLPFVPPHCDQPCHMFYLLMPSLEHREALIRFLAARGIGSAFHFVPLHRTEMGRRLGAEPGQFPVAESVADRLVRLPFYNELSPTDQQMVVDAVTSFRC